MLHAVYPIRKRLPHVGRKQKTRHLWQHMQSIVFFSSCTPNWKEQFCCSSPVFPRIVKNTEFHKIRTLCLLYHIIYDICNKKEAPGVLLPVKKTFFTESDIQNIRHMRLTSKCLPDVPAFCSGKHRGTGITPQQQQ